MGLNPDDLADDPTPTGHQQPTPPRTRDYTDDPDFKAWSADPVNAKHSKELRSENARYRIRAREAEQRLSALDPDGTGRMSLTEQTKVIRDLKMTNGIQSVAHDLGVSNVKLLRAYLHEGDSLKGISPDEPTFMDDLSNIVSEALEQEPALKGRPAIASPNSSQFRPFDQRQHQITRSELAGMSATEIDDARRAGRLDALLGRG